MNFDVTPGPKRPQAENVMPVLIGTYHSGLMAHGAEPLTVVGRESPARTVKVGQQARPVTDSVRVMTYRGLVLASSTCRP